MTFSPFEPGCGFFYANVRRSRVEQQFVRSSDQRQLVWHQQSRSKSLQHSFFSRCNACFELWRVVFFHLSYTPKYVDDSLPALFSAKGETTGVVGRWNWNGWKDCLFEFCVSVRGPELLYCRLANSLCRYLDAHGAAHLNLVSDFLKRFLQTKVVVQISQSRT